MTYRDYDAERREIITAYEKVRADMRAASPELSAEADRLIEADRAVGYDRHAEVTALKAEHEHINRVNPSEGYSSGRLREIQDRLSELEK